MSSDIGCSTLAITKWSSIDSGISSVSCSTTSSGALTKLDLRLSHQLHPRNSSESDMLSGSPILNDNESRHFDSKHNAERMIKENPIDDIYQGTESCLTDLNKLLKDSDNKCLVSENSCTQDKSDTKGTLKGGKE